MQIITLSPRGFGANTYAITEDGKRAIVIDPSTPHVADELQKRGLQVEYVLLTHCHFDHVYGVPTLQEKGVKVLCSEAEKPLIGTKADVFDLFGAPRIPYEVDDVLTDGEERTLCGITVKTMITPGHTAGSACFLFLAQDGEKALFTGDTLFAGCIGRTDFPSGNISQMRDSLKRLAAMKGDYPIYAGHNDPTTLEIERKTNPFMLDA